MAVDLLESFTVQANLLAADVVVTTLAELSSSLTELLRPEAGASVAVSDELAGYLPELTSLAAGNGAKPDIAITFGRLLVAATGSVLLAETTWADRVLRCTAGHHVAVTPAESIVPTMADAAGPLRETISSGRRYATFVSGPSRTGDIEQVLSIGAHGPEKLTIVAVSGWKIPHD